MTRWLFVSGTLALALPSGQARAQGSPRAGDAGRVGGTVTAAETGQPLPGTSVTLVGTRLGATTRADGRYTITGVRPGTYQVRAATIGYLGYTLPARVVSRLRTESARLYATAQDPFLFTRYAGFDPESGSGTVNSAGQATGAQIPSFRTVLFGLNLGF